MSNFGCRTLRLVTPYKPALRGARSAVGAADLLKDAVVYEKVAEAVADCGLVIGTTAAQRRELHHELVRLDEAAGRVLPVVAANNVAILFGSEKRGLSNEDMSHCHWLVRIPTRDEHASMNLGQAVAVCLYELARRQAIGVHERIFTPASAEELERLTHALLDSLALGGYLKPKAQNAEEKARRLVMRLALDATDATTLLGMFRKISGRLSEKPGRSEKRARETKKSGAS